MFWFMKYTVEIVLNGSNKHMLVKCIGIKEHTTYNIRLLKYTVVKNIVQHGISQQIENKNHPNFSIW